MGATPTWMLLCLSVPPSTTPDWMEAFCEGLSQAASFFSISLIGGDTTRSPGPCVATVTMGGSCVSTPVRRSGAQVGDLIWVTGQLGLAGAGWMLDAPPEEALARLRHPIPPVGFGVSLARAHLPTAMMDLSDGLAMDLPRLCSASGCGADVDPQALPMPATLANHPDVLSLMTTGGEDYELLFTSPASAEPEIRALAATEDIEVCVIGHTTRRLDLQLGDLAWPESAFSHFGGTR
jgi:thiamine-monophosphate kinase